MNLSDETTFVIGAGASTDFDFPTSDKLVERILLCLENVITKIIARYGKSFDQKKNQFADNFIEGHQDAKLIYYSIIYLSKNENEHQDKNIDVNLLNKYLDAANSIKERLGTLSTSIDEYLGRKQITEYELILSKISISSIIKNHEYNSILYENYNKKIAYGSKEINRTYLFKLFKIFSQREAEDIFKNRNFIIFNYDLCFEQLFFKFLQKNKGLDAKSAFSLIKSANIIHPYGTTIEFDIDHSNETNFGNIHSDNDYDSFIERARNNIKLHTDIQMNEKVKDKIECAIYQSKTVAFLGFGYHPDNLRLLSTNKDFKPIPNRKIIANFFKVSETNIRVHKERLGSIAHLGEIYPVDERISRDRDFTASDLIDEYSLHLH